ncbi:hypothetical protein ELG72_37070 [Rhizobium leguminosarum]|uniref:ATP-binding protein n=1 Tax=Rhizobium TaxID=379 RepID=UPI001030F8EE|nr:winged helix-turn-helix domain-containing protein [Rhizobium leguminosarum]TBF87426.1 hypothetical protein ELG82_38270 [Rhizobium leguminosarum]TBG07041.1 hypothetical protein ELG80_37460 [Rhizobium leguminosarum]TBG07809.1 hypothetical protein ELG81_36970 [Rhizobium leguminosarum]TBG30732.1 hypothetical protein ELG75_37160 [Rhizobium leguminosarum]TBG50108.1 hypothetical protein ELG72_37070 [Rhizobium leguminosarum]
MTIEHYAFGSFELHPRQRVLTDDGQVVPLGSRALELLTALIESHGDVVPKETLIAKVWPGVWIEESSLRVHVGAIRKALRDGQDGKRYVSNVPGRGYAFVGDVELREERDLASVSPVLPLAPIRSRALPVRLTRVIGRDDIVETLLEIVTQRRFLTIAGPGGIGKTTIALTVAKQLRGSFRDGVTFVDLSSTSSPDFVIGTLAAALNVAVDPSDPILSVAAALRDKQMLVILDSCEHIVEAAANLVEGLLQYTEDVSVIATSREALRGEGEWVQRIPPLGTPPERANALSANEALQFPAVQLLVERAAEHLGGFSLTDENATLAAEICRKLDGIALAIELAAGRMDTISLSDLAAQIDDRFRLLKSGRRTALPRHQTLRATLDWSYDRLSADEKTLLNRLSVLHGVFTFDAAATVCAGGGLDSGNIPEMIADLVAKSLIVAQFDRDEVHYRLLDTTRAYARERMASSGEHGRTSARHAAYVCSLFQRATSQWEEQPSEHWIAFHVGQVGNLRAALSHSFAPGGDPSVGVALTIAAVPMWSQLSMIDESLIWVNEALKASSALPDQHRRREMQLNAALGGLQMYSVASMKQATSAWADAFDIAVELEDVDYQLRALRALWAEAINHGKFRHSLTLAKRFQSLAIARDASAEITVADRLIACSLNYMGEIRQAAAIVDGMLRTYRSTAEQSDLLRFQFNQKMSARIVRDRSLWLLGYPDTALQGVAKNLDETLALDHTMTICNVLTQAACPVAILSQDWDVARRYVDILRERTEPKALDAWHAYSTCYRGEIAIACGAAEEGLDLLVPAMEKLNRSGFGHYRTSFLVSLARAQLALDRPDRAADALHEALEFSDVTGGKWNLAELHRWRGEIAIRMDTSTSRATIEGAFAQALGLAREQGALSWEIRAATSFGGWLLGEGRQAESRALLQDVHSRCTEGFERPDHRALEAMLQQTELAAP